MDEPSDVPPVPPPPPPAEVAALAAEGLAIAAEVEALVAGTMRAVVDAEGGVAGLGPEAARDVVDYLVRRGRMDPAEAARLAGADREAGPRARPDVLS